VMPDSFEFMSYPVFILTCSSRTILEKYLKPAVSIAEDVKSTDKKAMEKKCQTHFHLAHYTDALFRSHEERLNSNEWQSAMRLRKHKVPNLPIEIKRNWGQLKNNEVITDINCRS
jgi:serine-protein kinase ATM